MEDQSIKFGPVRAFLWPIHRRELQKFLPLFFIGFFTALNYFVLKVLKDTLLITERGSDADITSVVKLWGILPGALLVTAIFTKLRNYFSREKVVYMIIGGFLLFFAFFTFILYPFKEYLHPVDFCLTLSQNTPAYLYGFKRILVMFQYWTFSLFYVLAELWGSIGLTVLFWGFANDISKVYEAKRFYGPLGIGTNFAGVAGGSITAMLCSKKMHSFLPYGNTPWEQSLISLTLVVLLSGVIILYLYRWIHVNVVHESTPNLGVKPPKKPTKLSLRESFAHVFQNPYLLYIGVMVLALNIENHLVEVLWKSQVRELYPDKVDFAKYMSYTQVGIGFAAMLASLLLTGNVIRKFGWTVSAIMPPIVVLCLGGFFFLSYFFRQYLPPGEVVLWGMTPLALVAFLGTMHNVMTRAFRYSLFDATKELAFTPLVEDSRIKGKAAIDGVGSRFGKSAGAGMIQILTFVFPGAVSAWAPPIGGIVFGFTLAWIYSATALGKEFNALVSHKGKSSKKIKRPSKDKLRDKKKEKIESFDRNCVKQKV